MPARIANVNFACEDTLAVARFWSEVIGRSLAPGSNAFFASIRRGEEGPGMFFSHVPELKTVKNRAHLDLDSGGDREAQIAHLVGLGARRVADRDEWGHSWTVLSDPEGNEFCLA